MGRSFFGSDPMAAYRLNKRATLPKFNEGRNPFAPRPAEAGAGSTVGPAPIATAAAKSPKPENEVPKVSNLTIAQAVAIAKKVQANKSAPPYAFKPMTKLNVPPAAKTAAKPAASQPAPKAARPGWTTRLNPFRPPEPVTLPIAEQTELSLDSVKVVHNDLADADVEIVPVKSHVAPPVPVLPPARQAWEYLGENLLKSS